MFKERKVLRAVLLLMVGMLVVNIGVSNVHADEIKEGILYNSPIEISGDITINSKYVWRGFLLDDDPVMQQGVYVSGYGFTAGIWGSFDIDGDDVLSSEEVDYLIDYTKEFDILSISIGNTYYDFPQAGAASREFYVGVGFSLPLSPSITWNKDYEDEDSGGGDGDYIVLGLSHSLPLGESPITLDLSSHVGYNHELFINGDGGDIAIGVGSTIPLYNNCTLTPNISCSVPFGDLADSDDGNQDDEFYGGFTVAFSF